MHAEFGLGLQAWCRDCGAELIAWETRLRGAARVETTTDDRGGLLTHVDQPGACDACGGGHAAVRINLTLEP